MHITGNVIQEIKKFEDNSYDMIFSDPPYNLGSKWIIDENGKPTVKGKAVDFMNTKWEGLTGEDLESMFNDFNRILKHGGYVCFAGQMRQAMAFQYYAIASGLEMIEPIYSYSIKAFPKALDVSKSLDKHSEINLSINNITTPSSDLTKKYNGIKSSICPLKQTTEVWFIFRKSFKHGTITKDILAYEDGDKTITPSGLNIDEGRVFVGYEGQTEIIKSGMCVQGRYPAQLFLDGKISYTREEIDINNTDFLSFIGIDVDVIQYMDKEKAIDYICQYLDKFDVSKVLDDQSDVLKSGDRNPTDSNVYGGNSLLNSTTKHISYSKGDSGGCSRVLHNSGFTLEELYQHIYYSKASSYERNAGCSEFDSIEKEKRSIVTQSPVCSICNKTQNGTNDHSKCKKDKDYKLIYRTSENGINQKNNHPTLKSLKLLYNIITLFKTVDTENMKILIPFSGAWSEKIAMLSHGYKEENIDTIEISEEYTEIGKAREKFWIDNNFFFKEPKKVYDKVRKDIAKKETKPNNKTDSWFNKKEG